MSDDGDIDSAIMFGDEPLIDVARRCAAVVDMYGKDGAYTEKGIDGDAFELVGDFVKALGWATRIEIKKNDD